jgi:hypothetical protein
MDSLFEIFLRGIDSYAFSRNLFSGLKYIIALPTQTLALLTCLIFSSYRHVQCYFLEGLTQFGIENTYGQLYKSVCVCVCVCKRLPLNFRFQHTGT